jgi:hypothetical protein
MVRPLFPRTRSKGWTQRRTGVSSHSRSNISEGIDASHYAEKHAQMVPGIGSNLADRWLVHHSPYLSPSTRLNHYDFDAASLASVARPLRSTRSCHRGGTEVIMSSARSAWSLLVYRWLY